MPAKDGSGPRGEGPLSGRGLGPCGRGLARGRGFGKGLGLGRGFGLREPADLNKEEGKKILEAEKQEIEKRLRELE